MDTAPIAWTVRRTAEVLGSSEPLIRLRIRAGDLPYLKLGRSTRILAGDAPLGAAWAHTGEPGGPADLAALEASGVVFGVEDAADLVCVSERTVRRQIRLGRLQARRIGASWASTSAQVAAWLRASRTPSLPELRAARALAREGAPA